MTYAAPPDGWSTFGTHVETPVRLEFSHDVDEAGMPLWERPASRELEIVAPILRLCACTTHAVRAAVLEGLGYDPNIHQEQD